MDEEFQQFVSADEFLQQLEVPGAQPATHEPAQLKRASLMQLQGIKNKINIWETNTGKPSDRQASGPVRLLVPAQKRAQNPPSMPSVVEEDDGSGNADNEADFDARQMVAEKREAAKFPSVVSASAMLAKSMASMRLEDGSGSSKVDDKIKAKISSETFAAQPMAGTLASAAAAIANLKNRQFAAAAATEVSEAISLEPPRMQGRERISFGAGLVVNKNINQQEDDQGSAADPDEVSSPMKKHTGTVTEEPIQELPAVEDEPVAEPAVAEVQQNEEEDAILAVVVPEEPTAAVVVSEAVEEEEVVEDAPVAFASPPAAQIQPATALTTSPSPAAAAAAPSTTLSSGTKTARHGRLSTDRLSIGSVGAGEVLASTPIGAKAPPTPGAPANTPALQFMSELTLRDMGTSIGGSAVAAAIAKAAGLVSPSQLTHAFVKNATPAKQQMGLSFAVVPVEVNTDTNATPKEKSQEVGEVRAATPHTVFSTPSHELIDNAGAAGDGLAKGEEEEVAFDGTKAQLTFNLPCITPGGYITANVNAGTTPYAPSTCRTMYDGDDVVMGDYASDAEIEGMDSGNDIAASPVASPAAMPMSVNVTTARGPGSSRFQREAERASGLKVNTTSSPVASPAAAVGVTVEVQAVANAPVAEPQEQKEESIAVVQSVVQEVEEIVPEATVAQQAVEVPVETVDACPPIVEEIPAAESPAIDSTALPATIASEVQFHQTNVLSEPDINLNLEQPLSSVIPETLDTFANITNTQQQQEEGGEQTVIEKKRVSFGSTALVDGIKEEVMIFSPVPVAAAVTPGGLIGGIGNTAASGKVSSKGYKVRPPTPIAPPCPEESTEEEEESVQEVSIGEGIVEAAVDEQEVSMSENPLAADTGPTPAAEIVSRRLSGRMALTAAAAHSPQLSSASAGSVSNNPLFTSTPGHPTPASVSFAARPLASAKLQTPMSHPLRAADLSSPISSGSAASQGLKLASRLQAAATSLATPKSVAGAGAAQGPPAVVGPSPMALADVNPGGPVAMELSPAVVVPAPAPTERENNGSISEGVVEADAGNKEVTPEPTEQQQQDSGNGKGASSGSFEFAADVANVLAALDAFSPSPAVMHRTKSKAVTANESTAKKTTGRPQRRSLPGQGTALLDLAGFNLDGERRTPEMVTPVVPAPGSGNVTSLDMTATAPVVLADKLGAVADWAVVGLTETNPAAAAVKDKELATLQAKVSNLRKLTSELKSDKEEAAALLAGYQGSIQQLQDRHSEEMVRLQAEMAMLKSDNEKLRGENLTLDAQFRTLYTDKYQPLKAEAAALRQGGELLKGRLADADRKAQEAEAMRLELAAARQALGAAQEAVAAAKAEAMAAREAERLAERRAADTAAAAQDKEQWWSSKCQEEAQRAQQALTGKDTEVKALRERHDDAVHRAQLSKAAKERKEMEIQRKEEEICAQEVKLQEMEAMLMRYKEENGKFFEVKQQYKATINALENELKAKDAEKSSLITMCSELMGKLEREGISLDPA